MSLADLDDAAASHAHGIISAAGADATLGWVRACADDAAVNHALAYPWLRRPRCRVPRADHYDFVASHAHGTISTAGADANLGWVRARVDDAAVYHALTHPSWLRRERRRVPRADLDDFVASHAHGTISTVGADANLGWVRACADDAAVYHSLTNPWLR